MLRNGHVTFGMFNRTDKISDPALALLVEADGCAAGFGHRGQETAR